MRALKVSFFPDASPALSSLSLMKRSGFSLACCCYCFGFDQSKTFSHVIYRGLPTAYPTKPTLCSLFCCSPSTEHERTQWDFTVYFGCCCFCNVKRGVMRRGVKGGGVLVSDCWHRSEPRFPFLRTSSTSKVVYIYIYYTCSLTTVYSCSGVIVLKARNNAVTMLSMHFLLP